MRETNEHTPLSPLASRLHERASARLGTRAAQRAEAGGPETSGWRRALERAEERALARPALADRIASHWTKDAGAQSALFRRGVEGVAHEVRPMLGAAALASESWVWVARRDGLPGSADATDEPLEGPRSGFGGGIPSLFRKRAVAAPFAPSGSAMERAVRRAAPVVEAPSARQLGRVIDAAPRAVRRGLEQVLEAISHLPKAEQQVAASHLLSQLGGVPGVLARSPAASSKRPAARAEARARAAQHAVAGSASARRRANTRARQQTARARVSAGAPAVVGAARPPGGARAPARGDDGGAGAGGREPDAQGSLAPLVEGVERGEVKAPRVATSGGGSASASEGRGAERAAADRAGQRSPVDALPAVALDRQASNQDDEADDRWLADLEEEQAHPAPGPLGRVLSRVDANSTGASARGAWFEAREASGRSLVPRAVASREPNQRVASDLGPDQVLPASQSRLEATSDEERDSGSWSAGPAPSVLAGRGTAAATARPAGARREAGGIGSTQGAVGGAGALPTGRGSASGALDDSGTARQGVGQLVAPTRESAAVVAARRAEPRRSVGEGLWPEPREQVSAAELGVVSSRLAGRVQTELVTATSASVAPGVGEQASEAGATPARTAARQPAEAVRKAGHERAAAGRAARWRIATSADAVDSDAAKRVVRGERASLLRAHARGEAGLQGASDGAAPRVGATRPPLSLPAPAAFVRQTPVGLETGGSAEGEASSRDPFARAASRLAEARVASRSTARGRDAAGDQGVRGVPASSERSAVGTDRAGVARGPLQETVGAERGPEGVARAGVPGLDGGDARATRSTGRGDGSAQVPVGVRVAGRAEAQQRAGAVASDFVLPAAGVASVVGAEASQATDGRVSSGAGAERARATSGAPPVAPVRVSPVDRSVGAPRVTRASAVAGEVADLSRVLSLVERAAQRALRGQRFEVASEVESVDAGGVGAQLSGARRAARELGGAATFSRVLEIAGRLPSEGAAAVAAGRRAPLEIDWVLPRQAQVEDAAQPEAPPRRAPSPVQRSVARAAKIERSGWAGAAPGAQGTSAGAGATADGAAAPALSETGARVMVPQRGVAAAWRRAARGPVAGERAAERVMGSDAAEVESREQALVAATDALVGAVGPRRDGVERGAVGSNAALAPDLAYVSASRFGDPGLAERDGDAASAQASLYDGRLPRSRASGGRGEVDDGGARAPTMAGQPSEVVQAARVLAASDRGIVRALSRARGTAELVQVLVDRPAEAQVLARELPGPAGRLVQQIASMRTLPDEAAALLSAPVVSGASGGTGGAAAVRRRLSRAASTSARTVRGSGAASAASALSQDGAGSGRLMALSQKLMDLIHLAEVERKQEDAQRQVRRSDEKIEGPAAGAAEDAEAGMGVTLEALQREVLDAVQRELEMIRDRGEGGSNGGIWW